MTSEGRAVNEAAIAIERRLPEHQVEAAVVVFDEAFGDKVRAAVPDRDRRMAFFARVFDRDHVVTAVRDGELLGMAGLSARGGAYRGGLMNVGWDPRPLVDLLGWWGSMRAVWATRLAAHRPASGELYVDGIAVSPAARGHGIGTRLLEEVATIAREQRMRWVRLDVIDTNPRAQALYARLGYRVTKVQSFRAMERWLGFGGIISMELPVSDEERPSVQAGRAARPD